MLKKHLNAIAYCTALLLFLNAGLMATPHAISTIGADGTERIILCTSQGYQWVSLGRSDSNQQIPTENSQACSFCLFHSYNIDQAIDSSVLSRGGSGDDLRPYFSSPLQQDNYHSCSLSTKASRAPPSTL